MGRRGPAPKPAKLRLLEGARERDVNSSEPRPRDGKIEAPEGLSDDVLAIFDFVRDELDFMGIGAPVDRDLLVAYAEAVDKHRRASELLRDAPVLVVGMHGNLVKNPALQVQRDAAHLMRQLGQEFGLSPSARARIASVKEDEDDADNPFASSG